MATAEEHLLDDIANDLFEEKCRKIRIQIALILGASQCLYLGVSIWDPLHIFRGPTKMPFIGYTFLIIPAASMILQYLYGSFKKN